MRAITALLIKKGPMNKNSNNHNALSIWLENSEIHLPTYSLSNNNTVLIKTVEIKDDTKIKEKLFRPLKQELLTSKLISNQIITGIKYIHLF
ncbi:MAG: hypothetical protein GXC73_11005 [Chitinophagaceae bacterium]|nr:hypothetical protein [Chitinophagaceae bacterium]